MTAQATTPGIPLWSFIGIVCFIPVVSADLLLVKFGKPICSFDLLKHILHALGTRPCGVQRLLTRGGLVEQPLTAQHAETGEGTAQQERVRRDRFGNH